MIKIQNSDRGTVNQNIVDFSVFYIYISCIFVRFKLLKWEDAENNREKYHFCGGKKGEKWTKLSGGSRKQVKSSSANEKGERRIS